MSSTTSKACSALIVAKTACRLARLIWAHCASVRWSGFLTAAVNRADLQSLQKARCFFFWNVLALLSDAPPQILHWTRYRMAPLGTRLPESAMTLTLKNVRPISDLDPLRGKGRFCAVANLYLNFLLSLGLQGPSNMNLDLTIGPACECDRVLNRPGPFDTVTDSRD
jgi:hypothetical protein